MAVPDVNEVPRTKPRRLMVSVGYRAYRVARRALPGEWLLRRLLTLDWLAHRLSYELALDVYGPDFLDTTLGATDDELRTFITPDDVVLDLGCGAGRTSRRLAPFAKQVIGLDTSAAGIAEARRGPAAPNVDFRVHDITEGVPSGDVAVLLHVVEHLDDPVPFLASLPVTRIVVEVPDLAANVLSAARLRLGTPWWADDDHVRELTSEGLVQLLAAAGWTTERTLHRGGSVTAFATATSAAT